MIDLRHTVLSTGLPLVRLAMEGTRAVTVLVAFDAGARTERPQENGMAHFLEHMVFKGGQRYATYRDVNNTSERLGAQLNAYTSHDSVAFHITCRAEAVMEAADLLTDFVGRARLDTGELERERGVVIQEIARYDDQPAMVAQELLARAAYGEHPLGRRVLGPAEHLSSFTRQDLVAFRDRQWCPRRGGAFVAGDLSAVDDDGMEELFGRFPAREDPPIPERAPSFTARVAVEPRDTNQSHLCLHWRAPIDPGALEERAALSVYATLLGGSMGSRLFDEIREQRGLCYSIRAGQNLHTETASLEVASGLESAKCAEAFERIVQIVADLARDGPREEEVERARAYAAGRTVLALEGTRPVAAQAAEQKVVFGEIRSPEESIAALDGVTSKRVREVAGEISGTPVVACVGPHDKAEFE